MATGFSQNSCWRFSHWPLDNLLGIALVGTLVWLFALATRNALLRTRAVGRDYAYAVLAVTLLVFYALPVFGRSLSFAPADIVLAIFLLLFYYVHRHLERNRISLRPQRSSEL